MANIARRWCQTCRVYGPGERRSPSHLLHFFLTLCTFGLWLIVWLLVIFNAQYHCRACGARTYGSPFEVWLLRLTAVAVVSVAALLAWSFIQTL